MENRCSVLDITYEYIFEILSEYILQNYPFAEIKEGKSNKGFDSYIIFSVEKEIIEFKIEKNNFYCYILDSTEAQKVANYESLSPKLSIDKIALLEIEAANIPGQKLRHKYQNLDGTHGTFETPNRLLNNNFWINKNLEVLERRFGDNLQYSKKLSYDEILLQYKIKYEKKKWWQFC